MGQARLIVSIVPLFRQVLQLVHPLLPLPQATDYFTVIEASSVTDCFSLQRGTSFGESNECVDGSEQSLLRW
jgi:hypothetical protein